MNLKYSDTVFKVIREQLEELQILQPEVFGAHSHLFASNPVVPEAEIVEFERKHKIRLPEDYRDFLMKVGSGAGPYYGIEKFGSWDEKECIPVKTDPVLLYTPEEWSHWEVRFNDPNDNHAHYDYSMEHLPRVDRYFESTNQEPSPWHEIDLSTSFKLGTNQITGLLLICHHGCGEYFGLITSGEHYGELWFDGRASDFQPTPIHYEGKPVTFLTWYLRWLNECMRLAKPLGETAIVLHDLKTLEYIGEDSIKIKGLKNFSVRVWGNASMKDIEEFEEEYQVTLPSDYCDFVNHPHPGRSGGNRILDIVQSKTFIAYKTSIPYSTWIGDQTATFPSCESFLHPTRAVPGALPILCPADDSTQRGVVLVTNGEERGNLWSFEPAGLDYHFRSICDETGKHKTFLQWIKDETQARLRDYSGQLFEIVFSQPVRAPLKVGSYRIYPNMKERAWIIIATVSGMSGEELMAHLGQSAEMEFTPDTSSDVREDVKLRLAMGGLSGFLDPIGPVYRNHAGCEGRYLVPNGPKECAVIYIRKPGGTVWHER